MRYTKQTKNSQSYSSADDYFTALAFLCLIPILLFIHACVGFYMVKAWLMGPDIDWRPWFAWYPVHIEDEDDSNTRVWFEWVERRAPTTFLFWETIYRYPEGKVI